MPIETPSTEDLEQQAAESILGDSSLSDELTDDEARPLLDWGLSQAAAIAQRVAAQAAAETMQASLDDVRKLMKRISRFVGSRAAGDQETLRKNLERVAAVSEKLYGGAVPSPDETQLVGFLAEHPNLNNEQVVTRLLAMFAPPMPPPQPTAPEPPGQLTAPPAPEQLPGPEPPSLLPQGDEALP